MIILQLVISALTLTTMWLAGSEEWSKRGYAWKLALINQVLWFVFIIWSGAWGLLPLAVSLTFVYSRNLLRWYEIPRGTKRYRVTEIIEEEW